MKRIENFSKEVAFLKGKMPSGFKGVISQSYLRAEVDTVDGTPQFEFDFRSAKGIKQLTERLLNENDLFRVLAIRFRIGVRLLSNPAIWVPQSYPNNFVFDTETDDATAGTFDAAHLEALYNGYLNYKKGDTTYLPALSLEGARFVSQTQQTSAANKSSTEHNDGGIIKVERPFNLMGTDLGNLTLNIPAASNLKIQFSTVANITTVPKKIVLMCQLDGILVSGGNKIVTGAATDASM
ncbi:MAG: hypothetical protein ABIQ31_18610 [Ferruginibacter sp.]